MEIIIEYSHKSGHIYASTKSKNGKLSNETEVTNAVIDALALYAHNHYDPKFGETTTMHGSEENGNQSFRITVKKI